MLPIRSILILITGVICACNPDKMRLVEIENINFSTSDASELFFKNVRQMNYKKQVLEDSRLDIFTPKIGDEMVLNFSIAINWRYDQAYLQVNPVGELQDQDSISFEAEKASETLQYIFKEGNLQQQLSLATWMYNHVLQGFEIKYGPTKKPLFGNDSQREAFRKLMVDYYRLIEAY